MQVLKHALQKARNLPHAIFPLAGAIRFGILGKKIFVMGITGTDGKSSSVILTAAMLRAAGHRVAHFSSISIHDGNREVPNEMKMTTPGRMQLQRFLAKAHKNGCSHAVIEITSQGILQHRHRLIGFSLIGITNITPEHIEAHGGFERYQAAKISLARALIHSANSAMVIDDDAYEVVCRMLPRGVKVHTVKLGKMNRDCLEASILEESIFGSTLLLRQGDQEVVVRARLGGPFIARNILFSSTIASLCGVQLTSLRDAVQGFACIPGRFEIISKRPLIVVDYAHTLNALAILLPYVRAHTSGKLIHVFGAAGGGRDRYKRPLIAQLSEQYADMSILTEENSFDEPVEDIIEDIRKGFSVAHPVRILPRREEAVALAYSFLESPRDALLLTAKGSETVIAGPKRTRRPYNERTYIQCLSATPSSA